MAWQSGNQNVISQLVKGASEFAKLFRAICQTVKEDHRAFRALSMGQENRKANWVELRPFGALNLLKTAELLAIVARRIRMALQTFTDRAQRKIDSGTAEIRNDKERQN